MHPSRDNIRSCCDLRTSVLGERKSGRNINLAGRNINSAIKTK